MELLIPLVCVFGKSTISGCYRRQLKEAASLHITTRFLKTQNPNYAELRGLLICLLNKYAAQPLKGKVKAKSAEKSEFISINGEAHSARGAALLVNTTAQVYVKRKNAQYRAQIEGAIALKRKQIRKIEAAGLQSQIAAASS